MVELGHGLAAIGAGNFYATPSPHVKLERPRAVWHWGKVWLEKYWLSTGITRQFYRTLIDLGGRATGLDIKV